MRQFSQTDVCTALNDLGVVEGDNLIVHSSVLAFGLPGDGIDTFLIPLLKSIGNTGTLAAPTFSFSFIKDGIFDSKNTPSIGMGALSEEIRKHPLAKRSAHPIQSIAAIGAEAGQLASLRTESAYGRGSALEAVTNLNFKVLLLGAEPQHISLSHLSEERARVPYRFIKKVRGTARFADSQITQAGTWEFFARYLDIPIFPEKENLIVDELTSEGNWHHTTLNGAGISLGDAKCFCDRLDSYLEEDPFWMLPNPAQVKAFCSRLDHC